MINQQINLYQERFREVRPPMSAMHGLVLVGMTVLLLVVSTIWYHNVHSEAEANNQVMASQKQQLTQQLDALKAKLESLLADNQVDRDLLRVRRDIAVRKRMIEFVSTNQLGSDEGFADNLEALADIRFDEVWLRQIILGQNFVSLSGSALKAEMVPEYFARFQEKELFEGRVFDVFEVEREKQADWKVDFLIASRAAQ